VTSNKGFILDLICRRYPGSRPSDYFDNLDSVQKFQLDAGLALKYHLIETDERLDMVEAIQASVKNVVQALSSKKLKKDRKRKRLTVDPEKEVDNSRLPTLSELTKQYSGGKTVIVHE
jgi:hypothetical protein